MNHMQTAVTFCEYVHYMLLFIIYSQARAPSNNLITKKSATASSILY